MGGVGDEPAQLGLGSLSDGEGSLHIAQHPVEGGGQLRHLMIGVHSRVGDGSRDADLAMVQVQLRDCRGRRRQGPQGFRRGVGDGPGREGRRHHRHQLRRERRRRLLRTHPRALRPDRHRCRGQPDRRRPGRPLRLGAGTHPPEL